MTLQTSTTTETIKTPEQMYAAAQTALHDLLTLGQAYTIYGSRQVTMADVDMLREEVAYWGDRVLEDNGGTSRLTADMSDGTGNGGDRL
jgi:hypothetical protein